MFYMYRYISTRTNSRVPLDRRVSRGDARANKLLDIVDWSKGGKQKERKSKGEEGGGRKRENESALPLALAPFSVFASSVRGLKTLFGKSLRARATLL